MIFTVSYGNAPVERGLNVNNLILENNMKAKIIIVHHFVKGCMIINELLSHTFEINNDLILSVKNARGRYQQELEENKLCKERDEGALKILACSNHAFTCSNCTFMCKEIP